ncbi:FGLLP motif-containing membrane protein [Streptomyces violascens]|uniref:FGLLP motif-containing membrane protein n=1 Tax=Streptomyces violascens TaxID=67381 RepID=UPI00378D8841
MEKRLWQRSLCVVVGTAAALPAITGVPDPAAPERMVTTAATAAAVGSAPSASTPGPGPSTPLAGPTPPVPTHAAAPKPVPRPSTNAVFRVYPTAKRGGPLHVNGSGFDCAPGRGDGDGFAGPVTLTSNFFPPVKGWTDASGAFTYRYVVPANAAPGTYTVVATCASRPSVSRSGTFQVLPPDLPPPAVSLDPGSGTPRSTVNVLGTSLRCGAAARVLWDGTDVASGTASKTDWKLKASFAVPAGAAAGPHKVTVTCQGLPVASTGGRTTPGEQLTASAPFTVTAAAVTPPVSPSPSSPKPTPPQDDKGSQTPSTGHDKAANQHTDPSPDPSPPSTPTARATPSATPDDPGTRRGSPDPTSSHEGSGVAAPGTSPSPPPRNENTGPRSGHSHGIGLVGSLRTPAEVSWALKDLAGSAGLAVWFLLMVLLLEKAFPSQIADNALTRWWRRRRQHTGPARVPGWLRMGCYAVGGGALVVWADATTHWSAQTAVKVIGAAAGMLLILVTYEKTKDSLLRPGRGGVPAELRVVPAGLALAVVMAALSRWLESPVPYVYGLVAVYLVLGSPPPRVSGGVPKGQAVLVGGICTLAASLLVWTLGAPLVEAGRDADPGDLSYVLAYTVGLAVVGGVEVVVFGMLPLSGMDGRVLKEWNRPAWYALYLVALTFFFHVLLSQVHPGAGAHLLVSKDLRWVTVAIATGLFVLAWACSLGLRRWVARLERRAAAA